MKKIIWAVLAAFTLSLYSANAANFPQHGGQQMLAKHDSGKSHHGKKSKKHKKKHHKKA